MTDWRDMSTAPKDGRYILMYNDIWPEVAVAKWSDLDRDWRLHPDGENSYVSSLTHWMPLPEPPED